jgi:hypothetical protein
MFGLCEIWPIYFLTETPKVYAIPYGSFLYSNKPNLLKLWASQMMEKSYLSIKMSHKELHKPLESLLKNI